MVLDSQNINQEMFREILRLRVEYLKRSTLYGQLCEFLRENKSVDFSKGLPNKFQGQAGLLANYMVFGDVHNTSFSIDFAVFVNQRWVELFDAAAHSPVADYSEFISSAIDKSVKRFEAANGREPTLTEFRDYFTEAMKNAGQLYLRIDTGDHNMRTLVKQFTQLVRKHRKNNMFLFPTNYVKPDELGFYLEVYDLKAKGLTIKEIMQEKDPENKGNAVDTEREYKRFIQKAKRIISNVEKGVFPGNYQ